MTIDLKRIIKEKGINEAKLAEFMFPEHKFPCKALVRVLQGKSELTVAEIQKFSEFTGVTASALLSDHFWEQGETTCGVITLMFDSDCYLLHCPETNNTVIKIGPEKIFDGQIVTKKDTLDNFLNEARKIICDWISLQ